MTEYTKRITIVVPESMIEEANHFMAAIGEHEDDLLTFNFAPKYKKNDVTYCAVTMVAKPDTVAMINKSLNRPAFSGANKIDLTKAENGRSKIARNLNSTDKISVLVGDGGLERLKKAGFELVPMELDI